MKRINITNIFIILLASSLLGNFWAKPQYRKLKEKNQIIFQKEIVIKNNQQRKQKIKSQEEELKKYSKQMEIIKTAIPDNPSLFSFLNYLQKTVSENGLLLKNYSYSAASSKAKPRMQKQKERPSFGIFSPLTKPAAGKAEEETPSQPLEGSQAIKATSFSLSLEGPYSVFLSFLSALEKNSRLIEIDQVSLSSGGREPTSFGVNLKIYSY